MPCARARSPLLAVPPLCPASFRISLRFAHTLATLVGRACFCVAAAPLASLSAKSDEEEEETGTQPTSQPLVRRYALLDSPVGYSTLL
eukprot:6183785-Pleurochrysis_carterae.AAC.1